MGKHSIKIALVMLLASVVMTRPSHATTGHVQVELLKGGLIIGAGFGRGVLSYHGRHYRFRISGLSLGLTAGVSSTRLHGEAFNLHQWSDFAGVYSAVGLGGAFP